MVQSPVTLMKRYPAFVGSFLGTSLMALTYLIFSGLPRYFYGDDYLLLMASRSPNGYASSLIGCVNDLGSDKWRPMFVCTVAPVLKLFDDRYWCYFLLNLALIFLICLTVGSLLQRIVKISEWSVAFCVFVLPFSRFAWYGRVSPYGLMEFGALLFALLFVRQFLSALAKQSISSWYLAAGFATISALFHERYLVLIAAGCLVALFNERNERTRIPVAPWLIFSGSLLGIKLFLLQTDPLVGGGEAPFRSSADTWILEHFLVGVKAVAGIGNGTNIGFDESGYVRLPVLGGLEKIWLVALIMTLLAALIFKVIRHQSVMTSKINRSHKLLMQHTVMCQLLVISGLFLIIPASTVISRIEGRWLFGPEVFLFMFMIVVLRSQKWRIVIVSSFLLFSTACLKFLPIYEDPMRLSNEVMEYVHENLDGRTQLVYTIVDPMNRPQLIGWIEWVLGYGDKFKQIGVKSVSFVSNNECTDSCIKLVLADSERFDFRFDD